MKLPGNCCIHASMEGILVLRSDVLITVIQLVTDSLYKYFVINCLMMLSSLPFTESSGNNMPAIFVIAWIIVDTLFASTGLPT